MKRVEQDGFVLWEAWVDQNNAEAQWIRELQDRASVIEQRLANLEGQPSTQRKYIEPERYNKAMMLLDNIASAEHVRELIAWQKEVRRFLGLKNWDDEPEQESPEPYDSRP